MIISLDTISSCLHHLDMYKVSLVDPNPPALFVSDLEDANKKAVLRIR
jgi:hypothetical protein